MKVPIPSEDVQAVADWAELYVMATNSPLSKFKLANMIKTFLPELKDDFDRETLATSAISELSERSRNLYGPASHFSIKGDIIDPTISLEDFPELGLCLIMALKGVSVQKGKNNGTKYFEQICDIAAKTYLGDSQLLGFPNNSKLDAQIDALCKVFLEQKGNRKPLPTDKDGGVDIVAWRTLGDNRSNKLIVLIQCGAGKHFDTKKPINVAKWQRWIQFAFKPLTGMTTPKLIRDEKEWEDLSDYYNLIIDRSRIAQLVHNSPNRLLPLRQEVKDWCMKNIA